MSRTKGKGRGEVGRGEKRMDKRGNRVAKGNRQEAGGKQLFEEWKGKGKPRKSQAKQGSGKTREKEGGDRMICSIDMFSDASKANK
jgi:hypothetical protein